MADSKRGGTRANERVAGWLCVAPVVAVLGLFLVVPILMALWVSLTDWNGQDSPFQSGVPFAGLDNYTSLFTQDGLVRQNFMTSIRNNAYYVAVVVPLQTVLALGLALVVNNRVLKGKGFFRTALRQGDEAKALPARRPVDQAGLVELSSPDASTPTRNRPPSIST